MIKGISKIFTLENGCKILHCVKYRIFTWFPHREIRWNFGILCIVFSACRVYLKCISYNGKCYLLGSVAVFEYLLSQLLFLIYFIIYTLYFSWYDILFLILLMMHTYVCITLSKYEFFYTCTICTCMCISINVEE